MSKMTVINIKTDPKLKKEAARTAKKLGISLNAVLNNELKRFSREGEVSFEIPKEYTGKGNIEKLTRLLPELKKIERFSDPKKNYKEFRDELYEEDTKYKKYRYQDRKK